MILKSHNHTKCPGVLNSEALWITGFEAGKINDSKQEDGPVTSE